MGVTSIRLQPEIENPLEKLAVKLDRSKNYLINQAIKEFIERKNTADKRWSETLEAIDSVKAGKTLDSWGSDNELNPPKV